MAGVLRGGLHLALVVELGGAVAEDELVGGLPALWTAKVTRRPARTMIEVGW